MALHTRRPMFRIVAASTPAAVGPVDPIYSVIEAHQKAHRDYRDAVRIEYAYEDNAVTKSLMDAQQLGSFALLEKATSAALGRLSEMSLALVTTKPTTIAGIGAVCRYMKSLLLEEGTAGLLLEEDVDHDSQPGMATFCDTIAAVIEGMLASNPQEGEA
jgi:hypothetical protein